jgi:hypothetical protein
MKAIIFSVVTLCFVSYNSYPTELRLELFDGLPSYIHISEVLVSPSVFYENDKDMNNAGHKHRIIIITSGIYSNVYLDKLSLNVEGDVSKQIWSRRIDLTKLYSEYSLTEESDNFVIFEWVDNASFTFKVSDIMFIAIISEDENTIQVIEV